MMIVEFLIDKTTLIHSINCKRTFLYLLISHMITVHSLGLHTHRGAQLQVANDPGCSLRKLGREGPDTLYAKIINFREELFLSFSRIMQEHLLPLDLLSCECPALLLVL